MVYFDPVTSLCGGLIVLVVLLIHFNGRPKKFPPGPTGLPLLGYAPFLGKNPAVSLMKLKKKFGSVTSVQMGREVWVVLNDYAAINEALVKKGETFSGRPHNFFVDIYGKGYGMVTLDYGSTFKTLRRFGLKTLRGFGVGKKSMESNIIEEASYFVDDLAKNKSDVVLRRKFELAISNIICRIVFGSRFDYRDKRLITLLTHVEEMFLDNSKAKIFAAIVFAPPLRFFPGFRGAIKGLREEIRLVLNILRGHLDEHRETYDENDLRDFIDCFLKEMDEKGSEDPSFSDPHVLQYILDLFFAGTSTTASTILWSLLTFCHFPETQEKMAKEIKGVIGDSGTPTMNHRDQMPYTCAFIQEIMRLKTLGPLSFFHKTTEEAILGEYTIPKNTIVVPNLWAVHHNPDTFPDPDSFKPERFIDGSGNFVKSNHVIPFSVGPRHCLGEQLARMEIFLFLTSIVQKFKVVPDPKSKLPDYEDFAHTNALTHESLEFSVLFENR